MPGTIVGIGDAVVKEADKNLHYYGPSKGVKNVNNKIISDPD